ncbi:MAG: glycine dehydrogenase, partial [bacterium]|nr:glycine dehydrogenase [bacterium]
TYFEPTGYEIVELPYLNNGLTDVTELDGMDDLAAVAIQSPNFFGCIENLQATGQKAHEKKALFVASFTEALAYGLLKSPGSQGADIVGGEGQSLGIPRSFGGPALGMLASTRKHMRSLPGRLVGKTKDLDGKRGFVLTLATREQHIRREKATSNICTNNSLCALAAAMYMASVGGTGIQELARLNHDKSEYLKMELKRAGFTITFDSPTFNEFVVEFPSGFEATYNRLLEKKIIAGLSLAHYYPELSSHYLLCVTETMSKDDMDALVREVKS